MLRSARALLLFWMVFGSYGLSWLVGRARGPVWFSRRLLRLHERNAQRLAHGFARLGGIFIKMGQVLSVLGTFLPRAYAEALAQLQDQVPPRPFSEVEARLRAALGPQALQKFASFERKALAAASLAQVHRATGHDGRQLAVKVLYPGIEKLIRRDLRVLRWILPVVKLLVPLTRIERVLDQLSAMLIRETDYSHERTNIDMMRTLFATNEKIVVPEVVVELTADGILTMSFEEGIKIGDLAGQRAYGIDPEQVARLLIESYFTMLFEHRLLHADPHPGNFLVRPGPTLVILDYGAVEPVTEALVSGMKTVILGAITRTDTQILQGLGQMGFVAEGGDRELLRQVGEEYLKTLGEIKIEDFSQLDRDTIEKLSGYQKVRGRLREIMSSVQYPEGYFYVERTLVLLFGLVARLAPKAGLPGLVLPYAAKIFAPTMPEQTPPANKSASA